MLSNITYHDFSNLNYLSFFLHGFLANREKYGYEFKVSRRTPAVVKEITARGHSALSLYAVGLFSAEVGGKTKVFCLDTSDSSHAYLRPLLEKCDLYGKVNYDRQAVADDPELLPYLAKIAPTPLFLPLALPGKWNFRPRLLPCRPTGWSARDVNMRIRILRELVPLNRILALRDCPKDIDIFFVLTYYGEKIHARAEEFRARLIELIKSRKDLKAIAGFTHIGQLPANLTHLECRRYRIGEYLNNMARARVAIYVRGMHECVSFKLGQILALGLPAVGQPILNNRDDFYATEGFAEQFAFEQPEEIVEQAVRLLRDPNLRAKLGAANARAFDQKFNPQAVTAQIIERLLAG